MDVSIEQVGCKDLADRANVLILHKIASKCSKEVVVKKERVNHIIIASKYVSFAKDDGDDSVVFLDDRSLVLNVVSLLDSYKEGTNTWEIFETSGLTIVGKGTIIRKKDKKTRVKQCFRLELHRKVEYGYIQLYSTVSCEYDDEPRPRRSLLTFFIFRNFNAHKQMVFPPFQSLRPHNCQTYITMLPGQGLQVITPPGISIRECVGGNSSVSHVGTERRKVLDKEYVSVHRFVCKRKPDHKDDLLLVSPEGSSHGVGTFCPLIIPSKMKEWKDGTYAVITQPHTRAIVAGANIRGFIATKVSEENLPWVFNADCFSVVHHKDEVKVKFTGNPNYVMIEKVNGCWLLCESDQIVECI